MIIISRSGSKLGHVGSKFRSHGQILEKPWVHSRGHESVHENSRNFVRMLIIIMSMYSSKLGHDGSKTRSLGQTLEKPCVHSRGHSLDSKVMKLIRMLMIIISRISSNLGHVG